MSASSPATRIVPSASHTSTQQTCIICGGAHFRKVTARGSWRIHACSQCTNAFTVPAPVTDRQYENEPFYDIPAESLDRWRKGAAELLQFIRRAGCSGELLDVGCGSGLLLEAAAQAGIAAQGIEASHPAVVSAQRRGLSVQEGYFQDNASPADSFAVIVMSHVLEHVADPRSMARTAFNVLKPGGHLCLSQTNYLGTLPKLLGKRWYAWVPDQHFTHFSPPGLAQLLRSAGFTVAATEINSLFWDYVPVTRTPYRLWPGTALHNVAALINQARIGFPFVGDNMFVLAQKPEETTC